VLDFQLQRTINHEEVSVVLTGQLGQVSETPLHWDDNDSGSSGLGGDE
jgi:hypothetical protein